MSKGRKFNGNKTSGSSSSAEGTSTARFNGSYSFVSPYLDDVDREWLDSNLDGSEELVFRLVFELDSAFKFSLSWDAKTDRYLATLARNDVNHADSGKILTARAATPFNATYKLAYLHLHKLEAGWSSGTSPQSSRWD